MRVVCLPVSGGAFVSQLAAVSRLCEVNFVPDVCYSSSGGNVTAYVAAIADWKWAKTEMIASELHSGMLIATWSSVGFISPVIGYFKGDLFSHGNGVLTLFKKYHSEQVLSKYEIWTGTYNPKRQRARFFCNLASSQAKFKMEVDSRRSPVMEPGYMDGDLEFISRSCLASASVPTVVPGQTIEGEEYVDGGVASASPLTYAVRTIRKTVGDQPLHLWYINCDNLDSMNKNGIGYNLLDNLSKTAADLMRMQAVNDRDLCHLLLEQVSGVSDLKYKSGQLTSSSVKVLTGLLENIKYAMVEVYPETQVSINMVKFDGGDVKNAISRAQGFLHYRLWYAAPENTTVAGIIDRELSSM